MAIHLYTIFSISILFFINSSLHLFIYPSVLKTNIIQEQSDQPHTSIFLSFKISQCSLFSISPPFAVFFCYFVSRVFPFFPLQSFSLFLSHPFVIVPPNISPPLSSFLPKLCFFSPFLLLKYKTYIGTILFAS